MPLFETLSRHPELLELSAAVERQVEILPTSRDHYITGLYALNVTPPEDTSGDWHDVFHWNDGFQRPAEIWVAGLGSNSDTDTNPIYGDMGIYEGKDRLIGKGLGIDPAIKEVWVANHFRAILDMLYQSLKRLDTAQTLNGATDDWLDTPEQKSFVLEQALRLRNQLDEKQLAALDDWIDHENQQHDF